VILRPLYHVTSVDICALVAPRLADCQPSEWWWGERISKRALNRSAPVGQLLLELLGVEKW